MLGWFKKKFSKKKEQSAEQAGESALRRDSSVSEEEESFPVENVDEVAEETTAEDVVFQEPSGDEPAEEIAAASDSEEDAEQQVEEPGKISLEKPWHEAVVAEPVHRDGEVEERIEFSTEEAAPVAVDEEKSISVESSPAELFVPAESGDEQVIEKDAALVREQESMLEKAVDSDELLFEETFSEIIKEAEGKDEPEITDQPLEELLADVQPGEKPSFIEKESDSSPVESEIAPVRDDVSGEVKLDGVGDAAEAIRSGEPGLEEDQPKEPVVDAEPKIIDQPLEELLASEQLEGQPSSEGQALPGQEEIASSAEEEPAKEAGEATAPEQPATKSLFQRLQERLGKTRQGLLYRLDTIFLGKKEIDEQLLDELEEILITSDLGVTTTLELLDSARRQVKRKELSDPQALKGILRDKILDFLLQSDQPAELVMPDSGPFVIMVVGVNGVGKTTTIGKIANKFKQSGQSVLLIAGDTFRAAAIDQLKIWADRVGVEIVAGEPGADPSSVVFDGLAYGMEHDFDAILIDTAGRLHTSVNLMEELKKIKRVIGKKFAGAPHEVLLVLDATTGQNSIAQAKFFGEAVNVSGLALTKLDGTAKGGIVANVCREMKIPVRFIGIGEQMDDLRDFDAREFVDALFAAEPEPVESTTA
jgi:fused signal recognition particle receptor